MYETNLAKRLSQACVHSMTDLASLLADHRMSGGPILARYKHFYTIWEQTSGNSHLFSNSSLFSFGDRPNKDWKP